MSNVEETLAWEAQWRPRAAAAAVVGALCGTAGSILLLVLENDGPREEDGFVSLPESLRGLEGGQLPPDDASLRVRQADYTADNVEMVLLGTVLSVLGVVGALLALSYVFRATRARFPEVGRVVGWSVAGALALYPLGRLGRGIGEAIETSQFADAAERTAGAARELTTSGIIPGAYLLEILGTFALALAFVLVSMNAMRVGLFTRFMGILGVIVGALVVFGLDAALIVRGIWLVMLGMLIAGRYPGGNVPPAWATGRAEPWPTQQELRERRAALRAEHAPVPEPPAAGEEREPEQEGDYLPGAARRKRKKRR
ncbi:MAG TPA: hypothetical protein VHF89_16885 [Solirubrobacteraceae bacterium]|nr:hypothetical protein [Solirubrobacteraceae bacterium]